MDIQGVLVRDHYKTEHEVSELRFLGITIELGEDNMILLHQKKYIQEKLAEHGLTVQSARVGLPETLEKVGEIQGSGREPAIQG